MRTMEGNTKHFFMYFAAILGCISTETVTIKGPEYVQKGQQFYVSCAADKRPSGNSVEFLINEVTYTNLIKKANGCYSAVLRTYCTPDLCMCSSDGNNFTIKIDPRGREMSIKISCRLQFVGFGQYKEDFILVKIVDVQGPFISVQPELPLTAETIANVTCHVISTIADLNIFWDCFESNTPEFERVNETIYHSKLILNVKADQSGKPCMCGVSKGSFKSPAALTLDIINKPILKIDSRTCNQSSTMELNCSKSGDLTLYGFGPWTHSVNGILIRNLSGEVNGKVSTLTITNCNYQDIGEYTCTAWNNYSRGLIWTNRSGPPDVFEFKIYNVPQTTISVLFYSTSFPSQLEWKKGTNLIKNESNFEMSLSTKDINLNIYGTTILVSGYAANLSMKTKLPGAYHVVITNAYGATTYSISVTRDKFDFNIQKVVWILIIIIVFILTAVIASLCATKVLPGALNGNWKPNRDRKIYYAAPPAEPDNTVHTYFSTEPHYNEIVIDSTHDDYLTVQSDEVSSENIPQYIELS